MILINAANIEYIKATVFPKDPNFEFNYTVDPMLLNDEKHADYFATNYHYCKIIYSRGIEIDFPHPYMMLEMIDTKLLYDRFFVMMYISKYIEYTAYIMKYIPFEVSDHRSFPIYVNCLFHYSKEKLEKNGFQTFKSRGEYFIKKTNQKCLSNKTKVISNESYVRCNYETRMKYTDKVTDIMLLPTEFRRDYELIEGYIFNTKEIGNFILTVQNIKKCLAVTVKTAERLVSLKPEIYKNIPFYMNHGIVKAFIKGFNFIRVGSNRRARLMEFKDYVYDRYRHMYYEFIKAYSSNINEDLQGIDMSEMEVLYNPCVYKKILD